MTSNENLEYEDISYPLYSCELTVSGDYVDVMDLVAKYFSRESGVEFGGAGLDFAKVFKCPAELAGIRVSQEVAAYHERYLLPPGEVRPIAAQVEGHEAPRGPVHVQAAAKANAPLAETSARAQRILNRLRDDAAMSGWPAGQSQDASAPTEAVVREAAEASRRYQRHGAICEQSWMERFWGTESNAFAWHYGDHLVTTEQGVSVHSTFRCYPGFPRPVLIELGRRYPDLWLKLMVWTSSPKPYVFEIKYGHMVREYQAGESAQ